MNIPLIDLQRYSTPVRPFSQQKGCGPHRTPLNIWTVAKL
jgi:hypothetical protein